MNEGFRCLEEGIAEHPDDIDVVWAYGYAWPGWRGGPMFWADEIGARTLVREMVRVGDEDARGSERSVSHSHQRCHAGVCWVHPFVGVMLVFVDTGRLRGDGGPQTRPSCAQRGVGGPRVVSASLGGQAVDRFSVFATLSQSVWLSLKKRLDIEHHGQ